VVFVADLYYLKQQALFGIRLREVGLTPAAASFGHDYRFLTVLSAMAHAVYFAAAAFNDLVRVVKRPNPHGLWVRCLDYVFVTVGALSLFVCASFWGISQVIEGGLISPVIAPYYMWDLNLYHHFLVGVLILLEAVLNRERRFHSYRFHAFLVLLAGVCYTAWAHYLNHVNGSFPYPFLDPLSAIEHVAFTLGLAAASAVLLLPLKLLMTDAIRVPLAAPAKSKKKN